MLSTEAMCHLLRPGLSTSAVLLKHAIKRLPRATFTFRSRLAAQPAFHLYFPTRETGIHDESGVQTRVAYLVRDDPECRWWRSNQLSPRTQYGV